jgi:signal transduction histidine kinase
MQATDVPAKYILLATRMFNGSKRMSKLINDLIDFTRTHLGPGIPIRVKQGNMVAVCEEVVNELRTCHPERLINLHLPPRLDAMFDDSRIAQVLSNLIGNAIQYGNPDQAVTVTLAGSEDEPAISGIGLYISREIVHAHGGRVEVTSDATEGTTFILTIPRLQTALRPCDESTNTGPAPASHPS